MTMMGDLAGHRGTYARAAWERCASLWRRAASALSATRANSLTRCASSRRRHPSVPIVAHAPREGRRAAASRCLRLLTDCGHQSAPMHVLPPLPAQSSRLRWMGPCAARAQAEALEVALSKRERKAVRARVAACKHARLRLELFALRWGIRIPRGPKQARAQVDEARRHQRPPAERGAAVGCGRSLAPQLLL